MSDDIPLCVCGHTVAFHKRQLGHAHVIDECCARNCPCQEFEEFDARECPDCLALPGEDHGTDCHEEDTDERVI